MRVLYEHPPRSINYYLAYLALLILTLAPAIIIISVWIIGLNLSPLAILGLFAIILGSFIAIHAKGLLINYTTYYDVGLPKDNDISAFDYPCPPILEEAATLLEMEGFQRLGEVESLSAGMAKPLPIWFYTSPKGQILASLIELGEGAKTSAFIGFITYGENGLVTTTYPRGHQLHFANSYYSGVRGDLLAAYAHHREQVKQWIDAGNHRISLSSVQDCLDYDRVHAVPNQRWMREVLIDGVLSQILTIIALTPCYLIFLATFFTSIYGVLMVSPRLFLAMPFLFGGLGLTFLVGQRSKGIKKTLAKVKTNRGKLKA